MYGKKNTNNSFRLESRDNIKAAILGKKKIGTKIEEV